jgi:hypothetical protein
MQEAVGRRVLTLKMPGTAKVFLASMMMATMAIRSGDRAALRRRRGLRQVVGGID